LDLKNIKQVQLKYICGNIKITGQNMSIWELVRGDTMYRIKTLNKISGIGLKELDFNGYGDWRYFGP